MEELVLNALIENNNKYCVYGLRTDDRVLKVGDELGCSRDLYWENTEETYLPGTCATGFGYLWYDEDDIDEVRKALARGIWKRPTRGHYQPCSRCCSDQMIQQDIKT